MVPTFLSARFDVAALDRDGSSLVAIDPAHTILWFNDAWVRFANENGGADVPHRYGAGSSYLEGIAPSTRSFYEEAFVNALRNAKVFEHNYECSSPESFRLFRVRALPCDGEGLLLEHSLVVERRHDRAPSLFPHAHYMNEDEMISQCSNCRRVRRADGTAWDWVPEWVEAPPSRTSHVLCNPCLAYYWRVK